MCLALRSDVFVVNMIYHMSLKIAIIAGWVVLSVRVAVLVKCGGAPLNYGCLDYTDSGRTNFFVTIVFKKLIFHIRMCQWCGRSCTSFHQLLQKLSSSIIWGLYNRPEVAAVPSGLSPTPPIIIKGSCSHPVLHCSLYYHGKTWSTSVNSTPEGAQKVFFCYIYEPEKLT
jgi:hypothetical protein